MSMIRRVGVENFPIPTTPPVPPPSSAVVVVVIREYDHGRDKAAVEELEKQCDEATPADGGSKQRKNKLSVVTDMGDPISRVRNFSLHIMLVAELYGKEGEIVGVIRGCIKSVNRGRITTNHYNKIPAQYVKLACILGLRVSSSHRRIGIGRKLVQELEERCKKMGVEYTYMATECNNQPSVNLFTSKCSYVKFRAPAVLVQPVHAHKNPISPATAVIRIPPNMAELMYRRIFANLEFFPNDIDVILNNKLNLGTFMAVPKKLNNKFKFENQDQEFEFPPSYAIMSMWNTKEVYRLKVEGFSPLKYAGVKGIWALDKLVPWLRVPSVPNIFKKYFGYYFMYGIHMEGKDGRNLMTSLCAYAHNTAGGDPDCCFVVTEVNRNDPIREVIPQWKLFSWEDLWCMKRLIISPEDDNDDDDDEDWTKYSSVSSSTSPVTFVDPREF